MSVVNEELNPEGWTPEQQEAICVQLETMLGVERAKPYSAYTDAELDAALRAIHAEMLTRPGAVVEVIDSVALGGNTVMLVRG